MRFFLSHTQHNVILAVSVKKKMNKTNRKIPFQWLQNDEKEKILLKKKKKKWIESFFITKPGRTNNPKMYKKIKTKSAMSST